ncbi:MAG TPA: beta galactosidase jelly roll domain-containing protein [Chryseolinea sp.]|nr:beta galactosidase jelly roll domain-containing protein [Chryseolinea sp.]
MRDFRYYFRNIFSSIILSALFFTTAHAQDKWERVINLHGKWKFSIGDKSLWGDRYFNDSKWEDIYVPSKWEDEGFNGYNGYAWYRTSFNGTEMPGKEQGYNLVLGYIDDVDEVFFNGHKIGASGSFPPRYHTAYNAHRNYFIPTEYIDFAGKNVIAVRVYDSEIEGGIVSGDIGVFTSKNDRGLALNLRGIWEFRLGTPGQDKFNSVGEKTVASLPAEGWTDITVPSSWDSQGYGNYDGGAWYRKQFVIPKDMQEDLVVLLGKIDDHDKAFLNGKQIGTSYDQWDKRRYYFVTKDQIKAGVVNTLIVYVEDAQGAGGIYEGPVGIIKQVEFSKYIRWR